jgi:hypothetical protein
MRPRLAVVAPVVGALGCAPATVSMTMPNPARATGGVEATQSYDIPPYGEDHRYEVTLAHWTPATVAFRIHLINAESCGQPSSYSFQLVDDRGRRYQLTDTRVIGNVVRPGHLGATINDVTVDDSFAAAVDATTRYLTLQVRPIADRACTALDFRWAFQG